QDRDEASAVHGLGSERGLSLREDGRGAELRLRRESQGRHESVLGRQEVQAGPRALQRNEVTQAVKRKLGTCRISSDEAAGHATADEIRHVPNFLTPSEGGGSMPAFAARLTPSRFATCRRTRANTSTSETLRISFGSALLRHYTS